MSDSTLIRLRHHAKDERNTTFARATMRDAEQEIERLRDELAASREREARMREVFCGVEMSQFLTAVVTAAGLLEHGKKDKVLAAHIAEVAFKLNAIAFAEGAQG